MSALIVGAVLGVLGVGAGEAARQKAVKETRKVGRKVAKVAADLTTNVDNATGWTRRLMEATSAERVRPPTGYAPGSVGDSAEEDARYTLAYVRKHGKAPWE